MEMSKKKNASATIKARSRRLATKQSTRSLVSKRTPKAARAYVRIGVLENHGSPVQVVQPPPLTKKKTSYITYTTDAMAALSASSTGS
jgi:hypothetical protein